MVLHGLLRWDRRVPLLRAIRQTDRHDTCHWSGSAEATHREVGIVAVARTAENDLATRHIGSSDQLTFLVWVMRPNKTGLLPGYNQTLAVRHIDQHRAGREIPVRSRAHRIGGTVVRRRHGRARWHGSCSRWILGREAGRRLPLRTASVPNIARFV